MTIQQIKLRLMIFEYKKLYWIIKKLGASDCLLKDIKEIVDDLEDLKE
jgi:hypothetical protein